MTHIDHSAIAASATPVTQRQLECLSWVQEGKSANDIAAILGLSRRTVENHLARACATLGVRTRIQAVLIVRDLGVLSPSEARTPAANEIRTQGD